MSFQPGAPRCYCLGDCYHFQFVHSNPGKCQIDFTCAPVDVRVVLCKPGVSKDNHLVADTWDIEFGLDLMTLVLDNKIDCFSDLSDLIWWSIWIIQPNQMWELIGLKLVRSDKLVVNKFSCCATVYQCFHCQWMIAVDHVDLDRDICGPPKYLVSKGLKDLLFPFRSCISQFRCFRFWHNFLSHWWYIRV